MNRLFRPLFELEAPAAAAVVEAKEKAKPKEWMYRLPDDGIEDGPSGFVHAHTKSEARAEIKKRHNLKRVPVGTWISEIVRHPKPAPV